MMNKIWNKTALLGGDRRLLSAAVRLRRDGHTVALWDGSGDWREAIADAAVVLLPVPLSADGIRIGQSRGETSELRLTHLLEAMTPDQRIFAGRIPPAFKTAAEARDIRLCDYADEELFAIRNAEPTAEGAIEIALRELPVTLRQCKVAVVGRGRIGRVLTRLLLAFGAEVTVAARKQADLAWIALDGATPLKIEQRGQANSLTDLADCRVIFNTAPHWLLGRNELEALRRDVLIIDLASAPGGVDPQAALETGVHVIRAPGLPGKCAPETAGEIIAETVIDLMAREGVYRA